ncbi:hypothetical protein [Pseudomonas sp.]|uniref:hypothetical protein n=1 Tax=Pseudomonas sp. TaxID=306 RepID=UPI0027369463|nr:hypothetical protein [Pseudomonas sp.]MDP3815536.1 hypothetical protein [Pseudomonas sp.]
MDSRHTQLASVLVEQNGVDLISLDQDLRSPYRNAFIGRCSDKAQAHNQSPVEAFAESDRPRRRPLMDAARDQSPRFRLCLPVKQPAVAVESGGQAR